LEVHVISGWIPELRSDIHTHTHTHERERRKKKKVV
jgi:hypothetical protein